MMNPEMMRVAEEQMRRMPAGDLARMQQQLMSNPDLVKMASDSLKNMTADDFKRAAQHLSQARPEEMLDMTEKIAKARPEELAAMKAQADAQASYAMSGAKKLKQQGNQLHGLGHYADAAAKYKLAKDNLKNTVPSAAGRALQLQCTLNLMACYLKSGDFEECVNEGSEVLSYDSGNVKAYYRRGQAYKELGKLQAAVADLSKAHEISPEDETIARVLRDAQEKLETEGEGGASLPKGFFIQEIVEEGSSELLSTQGNSSTEYTVSEPHDGAENSGQSDSSESLINVFEVASSSSNGTSPVALNFGSNNMPTMSPDMVTSMADPAMWQMFASVMENMSPEVMANMSQQFGINLSKEDAANAQQAMSSFAPQDLERMLKWMQRAQQAIEVAKKTKNWIMARKGLVLAIVLLILAFILQRLGW